MSDDRGMRRQYLRTERERKREREREREREGERDRIIQYWKVIIGFVVAPTSLFPTEINFLRDSSSFPPSSLLYIFVWLSSLLLLSFSFFSAAVNFSATSSILHSVLCAVAEVKSLSLIFGQKRTVFAADAITTQLRGKRQRYRGDRCKKNKEGTNYVDDIFVESSGAVCVCRIDWL
jgi:hypothetical protein